MKRLRKPKPFQWDYSGQLSVNVVDITLLMIFELVGGPHDGSSLEAYPGIIQQQLYDPDSETEILAPLEIVTETRVHRYVREGQSQKLLYQGLV